MQTVIYTVGSGLSLSGNTLTGSGGGASEQTITITSSATTVDFASGTLVYATLSASTELTLVSASKGTFVMNLTQDSVGNRIITWPATVKWSGSIPPTLTSTALRTDVINFIYDGTFFYGTYALNF